MIIARPDRRQNSLGRCPANGFLQGHVCRDMDDLQPFGRQQHVSGLGAGQAAQHAGVTIVMVTGKIERFLVDRCRDDTADLACFGVAHRPFDEAEGSVTCNGAQLPPGKRRAFDGKVDHIVLEADADAKRIPGRFKCRQVAIDAGLPALRGRHLSQRANGDLRPYAARITHGYTDDIAHEPLRDAALSQPGARRTYLIARR